MSKDYFVMLNTQKGSFTPLIETGFGEDIAKFETEKDAEDSACNSGLGGEFGFEVFCIGCGL